MANETIKQAAQGVASGNAPMLSLEHRTPKRCLFLLTPKTKVNGERQF